MIYFIIGLISFVVLIILIVKIVRHNLEKYNYNTLGGYNLAILTLVACMSSAKVRHIRSKFRGRFRLRCL